MRLYAAHEADRWPSCRWVAEPLTKRLQAAQKPISRYLWTPSDMITFTPRVCEKTFGDGRALFGIGTIESRPAYWIIRGCSTWSLGDDHGDVPDDAPEFVEQTEDIIGTLEEEFGRSVCDEDYAYEGRRIRCRATGRFLSDRDIGYPMVNYGGGCHWFRLDWPEGTGADLMPHPYAPLYRILRAPLGEDEG